MSTREDEYRREEEEEEEDDELDETVRQPLLGRFTPFCEC
jgi:hypothetical protein